jgi:hypothetical protein
VPTIAPWIVPIDFSPIKSPCLLIFLSQFSQAYKWGHIKIWCKVSFFRDLQVGFWWCRGFGTRQASGLFIEGRCVGLRWLGHSKHARDTIDLSWFGPLSPYIKQYGVFLLGMPNRVWQGIARCYCPRVFGFYLGLIILQISRPKCLCFRSLLQESMPPIIYRGGHGAYKSSRF